MTFEEITQQLYEASQHKSVCALQFKDEPCARVVHPYGICQSSQNKILIICWQVDGYSFSPLPGYKSLSLKNCESVEIMDSYFQQQSNFNPKDALYKDWVFHI